MCLSSPVLSSEITLRWSVVQMLKLVQAHRPNFVNCGFKF